MSASFADSSDMERFTTSDGSSISYQLHPDRPPGAPRLALIHPLGLNGSVWQGVVNELSGKATLLTYDCRGHGASRKDPGPYTAELFARDLAELLDHVGWRTAVVAGCSMGGIVAQAFAAHDPDRLLALGLIDTTAWYGSEAPRTWRERASNARNKGLKGMTAFQASRWFSDSFRVEHADKVDAIKAIFLANDLDSYSATCEMLGDTDLRPVIGSIDVPVAIVVGDEDYATPVSMSRDLHERIPGSTLAVLRGSRHLTPVESPHEIAKQLWLLLRRVREGAAVAAI
jgi:3-oxoadipate enol-lactonase